MIPRFTNPSILLKATKVVSRKELFSSDDEDDEPIDPPAELTAKLNEAIQADLKFPARPHKRQKLKHEDAPETSFGSSTASFSSSSSFYHTPAFRLFGSSSMHEKISLAPTPLYTAKIAKRPPCEDSAAQRAERRRKAESVAVGLDWVMQESKMPAKPYPSSRINVIQVQALSLPAPAPALMMTAPLEASAQHAEFLKKPKPFPTVNVKPIPEVKRSRRRRKVQR
ncbi:hypothetical protein C8J56DRAFT_499525 [Mycena floridula]|nr:hypothetical protein C8J56DRAFT_499525 [Mycena floridula]